MPIDSILNYVCKYSPTLKMIEAEEDKSKYNRKYISALWLNGIGLFYNYTYGNQFTSLVSSTMTDQQLSNNLGLGYRFGVNVQFLLGEIYGRKSKLKSLQAEVEMAKQKRAEAIIEVKRKVISDYYDLIANQRLVKLKQTNAESAALTANIAEYEMKRGKIMPSDLSRLKNIQSMAFQKNIVENYFGLFSNLIFFTLLSIFIGCLLPYLSVVKTTKWQSIAKPITGFSIISYSLYLVNGGLINISLRQLSNWGEGWSVVETGIVYILYWITCLVVSAIIFVFFEKPMTDLRNRFK
ncbi:MAG: hypothetical protein EBZ58_08785 [Bacteroidetes bacterium]|nr:hypothetical protein [Bacteroidota bacterium]